MNRPNLFIVGASKCGTTALYTYLGGHPQIFMSPIKEPGFFARDFLGDQRPIRDLTEYLACFSGASGEKVIGEASTAYFESAGAPGEIKRFAPNARIIIMLRNPVEKIHAGFLEGRADNNERHKTLEAALESEKHHGPSFGIGYIESGRYTKPVRGYLEKFGRENVHIIIYDDFKERTSITYEDTLRFLGVDSDHRSDFPIVNKSRYVRSMALQEFLRHAPAPLRWIGRTIMPLHRRKELREWISRLNVNPSPPVIMKPETRERLQLEFETEVKDLGQLLGRDLSKWCKGPGDIGESSQGGFTGSGMSGGAAGADYETTSSATRRATRV